MLPDDIAQYFVKLIYWYLHQWAVSLKSSILKTENANVAVTFFLFTIFENILYRRVKRFLFGQNDLFLNIETGQTFLFVNLCNIGQYYLMTIEKGSCYWLKHFISFFFIISQACFDVFLMFIPIYLFFTCFV